MIFVTYLKTVILVGITPTYNLGGAKQPESEPLALTTKYCGHAVKPRRLTGIVQLCWRATGPNLRETYSTSRFDVW